MIALAVRYLGPDRLAVVDVLALAVFKLAYPALFVELFHLAVRGHITVIFAVGIYLARALDRLDKLDGFLHRLRRKHLGKYVQARVKTAYRERRVLVGVIRQNDGVHIVFYKIVERRVIGDVKIARFFLFDVEQILLFVAYRDDLGVFRALAVIDHARAAARAHNAHFYFLHTASPFGKIIQISSSRALRRACGSAAASVCLSSTGAQSRGRTPVCRCCCRKPQRSRPKVLCRPRRER